MLQHLFTKALADLILPRKCIVCGEKLTLQEEHLCRWCREDMPLTRFWQLKHNRMADKFNERIQAELEKRWELSAKNSSLAHTDDRLSRIRHLDNEPMEYTGLCDKTNEPTYLPTERYAYAAALFFYSDDADYKKIPYRVKYEGDVRAGKHFGAVLGRYLSGCEWFKDIDMIIPVPLHWKRKWKRGYNQAEIIAQGISDATGAPVRTDILKRRRNTKTQINLDIKDKAVNVAGAFIATLSDLSTKSIHTSAPSPPSTRNPENGSTHISDSRALAKINTTTDECDIRHILLIDDVFTTGSTLTSCFMALREVFQGKVRISVATLGFVGRF